MAENNNFEAPNVPLQDNSNIAYVIITEQPAADSHIFRYASELLETCADGSERKKRNVGSIVGVNSKPGNKTYPTIKVMDYKGPYLVVISLVGKDGPPHRPHPNNLIGTKHCKDGVYGKYVNNIDMTHSVKNVAIERVKNSDVSNSLRKRKTLKIDPYLTGFEGSNIDLKCVRLCFQVFLPNPDKDFKIPLKPIVSDPIYHRKELSHLTIKELSHFSAPVTGGTKMILLCDHVDKNDIEVWFYEKQGERILWQNKAQFGINDVHKSVAITFKTPPYPNKNVQNAVSVFVQLLKPSENKRGEPRKFFFLPVESGPQCPVEVPELSMQWFHEIDKDDSAAGNQFLSEIHPLQNPPSVSILSSTTTDPVIESCGTGTTIFPTTRYQLAQPVCFTPSSSADQQAPIISHDATIIMQEIPETGNTGVNALSDKFSSMELESDPGVENICELKLSSFTKMLSEVQSSCTEALSSSK